MSQQQKDISFQRVIVEMKLSSNSEDLKSIKSENVRTVIAHYLCFKKNANIPQSKKSFAQELLIVQIYSPKMQVKDRQCSLRNVIISRKGTEVDRSGKDCPRNILVWKSHRTSSASSKVSFLIKYVTFILQFHLLFGLQQIEPRTSHLKHKICEFFLLA